MNSEDDTEAMRLRVLAAEEDELKALHHRLGRHLAQPVVAIATIEGETPGAKIEDAEVIEDQPTADVSESEQPKVSMSDRVTTMVDEYLAADEEITRQETRLIELRGSRDQLTEDDHLLLQNLRDFVLQRYEQLLET